LRGLGVQAVELVGYLVDNGLEDRVHKETISRSRGSLKYANNDRTPKTRPAPFLVTTTLAYG
jgi:hypothetical protein